MTEYAPNGLFGVLTPQANTTVEAEFQLLCPPGTGMLTARLTSDKPVMDDRLADYVLSMDTTITRFANAPIGAVAFACTGASYLVDPEAERRSLGEISARRGVPVLTAANAVAEALGVLGAVRVGVVSPYGDALHDAGMRYWTRRGFEVAQVERLVSDDSAFHPIYALAGGASRAGVARLDPAGLDAIVILGTGLPTLETVLYMGGVPVPVITPNLALMWRTLTALSGATPTRDGLMPWLTGAAWGAQFRARQPAVQPA